MVLAWINQCCGITCIVIIGQIVHLYIRMVLVQLPAMVSVCTLDVGMMRIDYIYFIDEGLSPHIGCCAEIEDDEVTRDRNRRTEGGEWEPIKISLEIHTIGLYSKITTIPQEF